MWPSLEIIKTVYKRINDKYFSQQALSLATVCSKDLPLLRSLLTERCSAHWGFPPKILSDCLLCVGTILGAINITRQDGRGRGRERERKKERERALHSSENEIKQCLWRKALPAKGRRQMPVSIPLLWPGKAPRMHNFCTKAKQGLVCAIGEVDHIASRTEGKGTSGSLHRHTRNESWTSRWQYQCKQIIPLLSLGPSRDELECSVFSLYPVYMPGHGLSLLLLL